MKPAPMPDAYVHNFVRKGISFWTPCRLRIRSVVHLLPQFRRDKTSRIFTTSSLIRLQYITTAMHLPHDSETRSSVFEKTFFLVLNANFHFTHKAYFVALLLYSFTRLKENWKKIKKCSAAMFLLGASCDQLLCPLARCASESSHASPYSWQKQLQFQMAAEGRQKFKMTTKGGIKDLKKSLQILKIESNYQIWSMASWNH